MTFWTKDPSHDNWERSMGGGKRGRQGEKTVKKKATPTRS